LETDDEQEGGMCMSDMGMNDAEVKELERICREKGIRVVYSDAVSCDVVFLEELKTIIVRRDCKNFQIEPYIELPHTL
jgi:hypothetical protein